MMCRALGQSLNQQAAGRAIKPDCHLQQMDQPLALSMRFLGLSAHSSILHVQLGQHTVNVSCLQQVRDELGQVPGSRAWAAPAADGAANLPAFNAYPQPHATAVGEYLMALPQMLEGLGQDDAASAAFDGDDDAQGSEWLDRVSALARPYKLPISPVYFMSFEGVTAASPVAQPIRCGCLPVACACVVSMDSASMCQLGIAHLTSTSYPVQCSACMAGYQSPIRFTSAHFPLDCRSI